MKSDHLVRLIQHYGTGDPGLVNLVINLREIEETVRNKAAHEMVMVTDDTINRYTRYHAKDILEMLKRLFKYSSVKVNPEDWKSYDRMNEMIIERMSAS